MQRYVPNRVSKHKWQVVDTFSNSVKEQTVPLPKPGRLNGQANRQFTTQGEWAADYAQHLNETDPIKKKRNLKLTPERMAYDLVAYANRAGLMDDWTPAQRKLIYLFYKMRFEDVVYDFQERHCQIARAYKEISDEKMQKLEKAIYKEAK